MGNYYLAIDIGASSGRHMLGHMNQGRMELEEIYRFENGLTRRNGYLCWNHKKLFEEILAGIRKCKEIGKIPVSMGIDTWGVDFVLLDEKDQVIGDTVGYRDGRTKGMDEEVYRLISEEELYAGMGVDAEHALEVLKGIPISMHCWQGDDVTGFDSKGPLTGGIQATGNYPGKAQTPEELMADMDKVLSFVPGTHKINLHASYAIFEEGEFADRDALEPKHFAKWVEFARKRGMGLDFNPTLFSHEKVKDNLTLSSPDEKIRNFWIRHCQACIRISEYFATELGQPCTMNIWIPDGYKDIPADRMAPRARFKDSLDQILSIPYDKEKVLVCLESKVFGIGMESYTVGSSEFTVNYAMKNGILPLMDNGHYHPTEVVSDKIPSMLLFFDKIALHVTRPVRWDSDHVVLFDDETKEIAKEIVRNDAIDRVMIGLDFFDASINRICAWTMGMRNFQKALLYALLTPNQKLAKLQED